MATAKVTVLGTTQVPVFDAAGKARQVIRTRWMYGDTHGPYTTDLPADSYTAAAFAAAVQPLVAELDRLPK